MCGTCLGQPRRLYFQDWELITFFWVGNDFTKIFRMRIVMFTSGLCFGRNFWRISFKFVENVNLFTFCCGNWKRRQKCIIINVTNQPIKFYLKGNMCRVGYILFHVCTLLKAICSNLLFYLQKIIIILPSNHVSEQQRLLTTITAKLLQNKTTVNNIGL